MSRKIIYKGLRKLAWELRSEYVRRKDADSRGNVRCFICGAKFHYKKVNAGHYIHRNALDFDRINIQISCIRCNRWLHGNLGLFACRLIEVFGLRAYRALEAKRNIKHYFSRRELDKIIKYYKNKLEQLKVDRKK